MNKENLDKILDQIAVVPFKYKHLPLLKEMLEDQEYPNVDDITMKTIPKIGYIALLNKQPIAAGFLRRVECNIMAQLDGLTSNPFFGSQIRHKGITEVVNRLVTDAKDLKLKGIIAFTSDCSVIKRAEDIGFLKISHQVISLSF